MMIAKRRRFAADVEELNLYASKDMPYTIAASTTTISKFGPSGSLKKANMALEHTRAVMAKIVSETFFDLKYIF